MPPDDRKVSNYYKIEENLKCTATIRDISSMEYSLHLTTPRKSAPTINCALIVYRGRRALDFILGFFSTLTGHKKIGHKTVVVQNKPKFLFWFTLYAVFSYLSFTFEKVLIMIFFFYSSNRINTETMAISSLYLHLISYKLFIKINYLHYIITYFGNMMNRLFILVFLIRRYVLHDGLCSFQEYFFNSF